MKVLIVQPRMYVYGGAELLIVRLANYLTKKGIRNALLTTNILPEIEADLTGTDIIKYEYTPSSRSYMNYLKDFRLLNKGVREHCKNFDIVNLHNFPAELSIFLKRTPAVWMCNEPPEIVVFGNKNKLSNGKKLIKNLILAFDRHVVRNYIKENAIVSDEFNRARFQRIYNINSQIINYGIDYDFFSSRPSGNIFNFNGKFTVLHVGIIIPLKNQMESIKTIDKLRGEIPDIKLILAGHGNGQYFESLNDYIRKRQLEKHVEITGHLSRENIRNLFHTCNVLIHPVRSQGGWLSPFEALCAKIPIVVSSELTAAGIIKKEDLGVVTDNYTEAVMDIYEQLAKYKEKTSARAEWVKENLGWSIFCEKMVKAFHEAINKG